MTQTKSVFETGPVTCPKHHNEPGVRLAGTNSEFVCAACALEHIQKNYLTHTTPTATTKESR